MELSIKIIILLLATLFTGLSAGLCFTWANAITPGIGRLDDIEYLRAFQQINRTIINPLFLLVFLTPFLFSGIGTFLLRSQSNVFWLLVAATIIYLLGLVLVTMMGNLPLNEILDKTELSNISLENARDLRERFEAKWNNLHLIRTISTAISFSLLILTCLLYKS